MTRKENSICSNSILVNIARYSHTYNIYIYIYIYIHDMAGGIYVFMAVYLFASICLYPYLSVLVSRYHVYLSLCIYCVGMSWVYCVHVCIRMCASVCVRV